MRLLLKPNAEYVRLERLQRGLDPPSLAYVCIVVAAVMSTVYIVFARFDRLSFDRQEKFIHPAMERMKSFTQILDTDIAKLFTDRMKQLSEVSLSSTAK
eukprot:gene69671-biopygen49517